ncbi:MAG: hypothetical protein QXI54_07490 [Archaeoglobaceae archaeon]
MLDGIPKKEYPKLFYRYIKEFFEVLSGKTSLKLYLVSNYPSFYKAEFREGEVLKWKGASLPSKFIFEGKKYKYFYHSYNTTWKNERAVEIPILYNLYLEYLSKKLKILEIGNVFSHYFNVKHVIVDKYEKAPNVINEDVVDFSLNDKFDFIFSISTLEHVGWDEKPREPGKIFRAVSNLKDLLAENGLLVITLPVGYNPVVDELLKNENKNPVIFDKIFYMKKVSICEWEQCGADSCLNLKYDFKTPSARAVAICLYKNNKI